MDFTKITLLPEELKLLRRLARRSPRQVRVSEGTAAKALALKYHLIQELPGERYILLDDGKRFLRFWWEDCFRHRWPVYLSIAAIAISGAAFVKSFFF